MIEKIIRFVSSPQIRFNYLSKMGLYNNMSDEDFLRKKYKMITGNELDLNNPKTYDEKIQWLKIHDRRPEYTMFVDKYHVKDYVAGIIGKEHIIPTIGVWDNVGDIDFDSLPNGFVLKTTHDSGGIYICRNRAQLDIKKAKRILTASLKRDYFYAVGREKPYKDVPRKIIAEPYMVDESGKELKDYKVFTFWGVPRMIQVDYDRFVGHKRNLYTPDWEYIEATIQFPTDRDHIIDKPECLNELLDLSKKLSCNYPHIRCDFYIIRNNIYFGELTLHHGSGFEKFSPESFGYEVGSWLDLDPLM